MIAGGEVVCAAGRPLPELVSVLDTHSWPKHGSTYLGDDDLGRRVAHHQPICLLASDVFNSAVGKIVALPIPDSGKRAALNDAGGGHKGS